MINTRSRRHHARAEVVQQLNQMQRRTRGLGEIAVVVLDRKFSKMLPDQRSDIKLSVPESRFDWSVADGEFLFSRSSNNIAEVMEGIGKALGVPKENIEAAVKG